MDTGILIASFGSTHMEAFRRSAGAVERDIAAAFPAAPCYRAFTSGVVRSRLEKRDETRVDSVPQALARIRGGGLKRLVVQPTLLVPGEEYDILKREVWQSAGELDVRIGRPLLWDEEDLTQMIRILKQAFPLPDDTLLLAMGHGTKHAANRFYKRLAEKMAAEGRMGFCTVEGQPGFEEIAAELLKQPLRRVHLVPLLLVAGEHSQNDMAGEGPNSLRRRLERQGFAVSWSLQGLGELPAVRECYVKRVRAAWEPFRQEKKQPRGEADDTPAG